PVSKAWAKGKIDATGDKDFFKVTMSCNDRVNMYLTPPFEGVGFTNLMLDLMLRPGAGKAPTKVQSTGGFTVITQDLSSAPECLAGAATIDVFARITGVSGATSSNRYFLQIDSF